METPKYRRPSHGDSKSGDANFLKSLIAIKYFLKPQTLRMICAVRRTAVVWRDSMRSSKEADWSIRAFLLDTIHLSSSKAPLGFRF